MECEGCVVLKRNEGVLMEELGGREKVHINEIEGTSTHCNHSRI